MINNLHIINQDRHLSDQLIVCTSLIDRFVCFIVKAYLYQMGQSAVRARILDVASKLFYEQGYHSTGINQIIDEAEIAKASLYNHFPSKADVLLAYLEEAHDVWFEKLRALLAPVNDPKKKILALFDERINSQITSDFGGCRFIKISIEVAKNDLRVFSIVSQQKSRLKILIKTILKQIDTGNRQILTLDLLAETIFLLLEGAMVSSTIDRNAAAMVKAKKIVTGLI